MPPGCDVCGIGASHVADNIHEVESVRRYCLVWRRDGNWVMRRGCRDRLLYWYLGIERRGLSWEWDT